MKLKLRTKLVLCGILSITTVGALGVFSRAVHAANDTNKKDYVLTVSPAKLRLGELQPGKTYSGTFNVINDGAKPLDYEVSTTGFQVKDESYDPIYEDGNFTTISKWISYSRTSGHLEPEQEHEITYTVKIPADAPAGGQYASIMVTSSSAAQDDDVIGNIGRIGLVVYSHVTGETTKCYNILTSTIPTFLANPPITASSLVENCGNVDADAEYVLRVFPLFSDEEIYTNEENPDIKTILPGTKRFNSISWEGAPTLGIYRAEQTVSIGDEEDTVTKIIVICPLWLIVLIIVFIAAAVFWLVARNRERKEASKSKEVKENEK